ncbi:MAG: GNAT family N-acetyltransferase, partial [Acidobacteriota bacterium]
RAFPPPGQTVPAPWTTATFAALLAQPTTRRFALRAGDDAPSGRDALRGYALVQQVLDEAELLRIAVDPDARRRGHGRRLLEAVHAALAADGVVRLHLEVHTDSQAARQLYVRCGHRPVGRRPRYYRDGADAVLYARALG